MTTARDDITTLINSTLMDLGYELVEINQLHSEGALIQVVVERLDRSTMTVADCEKVSRSLVVLLDLEDFSPSKYTLEVTSPGIDRVLNKPEHFQRFAGYEVDLEFSSPIKQKNKMRCRLEGLFEDNMVKVYLQTK